MSTILIKNGTVVDGSGAPAYEADILIKGDTIAAIGQGLENQPELADEIASADIIDAAGKTITPGKYQDASFVRIKDITLSYTIPQKALSAIRMSNAKVYFSAKNL